MRSFTLGAEYTYPSSTIAIELPISDPVIVAQRLAPAEFIDILTSQADPCCPWSAFALVTTSPVSAGPRLLPSPLSANSWKYVSC